MSFRFAVTLAWLWMGSVLSVSSYLRTSATSRLPAQATSVAPVEAPANLEDRILALRALLQDPQAIPAETCAARLGEVYQGMVAIEPSREILAPVEGRLGFITHAFFEARLDLRARLLAYHESGSLTEGCMDQARALMRALRYAEEYLAEVWVQPASFDPKNPAPYLKGAPPYLQIPEGRPFSIRDLRSGDLLLSRGNAITSAAIARMAAQPGQFSHVAFLHVDPRTQKKWVLEAHIEVGTTVRSFEEYAADGNFRVSVLRARTAEHQELAARAAAIQHQRLKEAQDQNTSVPYDFGMVLSNPSELFCSEVVYEGFQRASGGGFAIPLFMSRIEPKNRDFLDRLGIRESRTFMPSDLDVDPRFEVLAEWRDVSRVADVRRKDAVLDRFYAWSDEHGYRLGSSVNAWLRKTVIWRLRRWPVFSGLLKDKFPLNMSRSVMQVITVLTTMGEAMLDDAEALDRRSVERRGLPLSYAEMSQALDLVRTQDLARHERWLHWRRTQNMGGGRFNPPPPPSPHFTHLFHP